jgi:hypothetical protein
MKVGRINRRNIAPPRSQRGVVLLIALIILVAMTMAGIGMMRSIDTGSVIAGNLAFKQATTNAGDAGTSTGFNQLAIYSNPADGNSNLEPVLYLNGNNTQPCPTNLGADQALCPVGTSLIFQGYSSTPISPCEVTGQTTGTVNGTACTATQNSWWTVAANWNGAPSITVTDPNGGNIATVSYLIHRMCQVANTAPTPILAGGQLCQSFSEVPACHTDPCPPPIYYFFYRITSRSVGPRNTVTYAQTLAMIP